MEKMSKLNSGQRNFLKGALFYIAGAAAGFFFIFVAARLGLVSKLVGLIDENQYLVKLLGIPVSAGLVLALGGGILGSLGGWGLASILGISRKRRQVIGSGIAFAVSISLLTFIFLLLLGFIGIYNNFTANPIDQYLLVFGVFGLIFGLLTGIVQSLLSLRLRDTWQLIISSALGFGLGGVIMGALVRVVNPTSGFQTYPILTWIVLLLALAFPFALGGGAMGFTYGRLAKRAVDKGHSIEIIQPSAWQTGIVALLGFLVVFWFLGIVNHITEFLTIYTGNTNTQLASETVGVRWTESKPFAGDVSVFEPISDGVSPVSVTGPDQVVHKAWCSPEGKINYQRDSETVEKVDFPGCQGTPALALGADGLPHLVWYATEIRDTTGVVRADSLLVESILSNNLLSEPAIVAHTASEPILKLTSDEKGNLLLIWQEADQKTYEAVQEVYTCDKNQLSGLEQSGLRTILTGNTRPVGTAIPFCRNQFSHILYTPNPEPAYSNESATPNSAFDKVSAAIVSAAHYEVLFSTMQYEPSTSPPSPGNVLAEGIAALYKEVKAHPENYPRGMTVRILLGNYPVVSNLEYGSQIKDAISDFRAAGVEKMVDPSIGWRLEFANFPGAYPHSHTKFVVIDGERVTSVGFNYGYLHLPKDHPSGLGYDLLDLGLSMVGPVAQDAVSVYDDMWQGANQVYCADFYPADGSDWQKTCVEKKAVADHMPEILRYYLPPEGRDNAFSLYRNSVFKEADNFIAADLAASTDTIDMMETNFSLEMVCMLNIIFPDFCTIDNALPWMNAMLEGIKNNHAHVRVIMENSNSNGLENRVAGKVLMDELKRLGLEDQVELRFYNGKIHAKSILIDGKLLIIGSQNLHYSAWGEKGLNEYNVATDDQAAISEYKGLFDYKWQQSTPFDEAKYGTSP
jgi:phosphatidylserine/phosphatidylglycerophosphate/cardiolipin synthase-like enzyme